MAEQPQDRNKGSAVPQQQQPPPAAQPWGHWKQQHGSTSDSSAGSAASSVPVTPTMFSSTAATPASHNRSAAAIQRFAAALDAAGVADPAVRALAGHISGSNAGDSTASGSNPGSTKSSEGGAHPSSSNSSLPGGLATAPGMANSAASCSSVVSRQVQKFAADVQAAGLANVTFMAIAASVPEGVPAAATTSPTTTSSSRGSSSKYDSLQAGPPQPDLLTGSSSNSTSHPLRSAAGSGLMTGYSAFGTLAPMRSRDYGTLPHGWCDSTRSTEVGEASWYGKWPGTSKPSAAAAAAAGMREEPEEYASRGAPDPCFWIRHSAGHGDEDLRSYDSSNSCISVGDAAEHKQPVLLEGLSKRPTSMYQSVDAGSLKSQGSSAAVSAADLQGQLAAASAGGRAVQGNAAAGILGGGAAAGAAVASALGGLKKLFGLSGSKSAGSIPAVQPLQVEHAISIAHKMSSIDNPEFKANPADLISASSSQQQEAPSCQPQLDKGLRCRVSTASSCAPAAAAARLGSGGGLLGHRQSAGSVGACHRATPLSSKEHLGSLGSSLRSTTDNSGVVAAAPSAEPSAWRFMPASWCATRPAAATDSVTASIRSKGSSTGRGSSKRSGSSSSGSSHGGKQAAGQQRKHTSLILLLSLIVVLAAAGMGIGIYFGLLRPAPEDSAKGQAATAFAVAQLYDVADSPGTPDAAAAAAVGAVPPMNFQVVLAVPAVSADQGCSTWFSSAERLQQYKAVFAASYTEALKQPVQEGSISAITCGGTLIYKTYTSAAALKPSSSASAVPTVSTPANQAEAAAGAAAESNDDPTAPMQPAAGTASADRAAAAAMPTRTLLAYADFWATHNSQASQRSLLQQRKNVLSLVEVVTRFQLPAPASHAERTAIAEAVVTGSSAILSGPMSEFFKVPSALMDFVPWSNNNNNNNNADNLYKADIQEAALLPALGRTRAAVPVMQPRLSYAEAPTCLFPLTRSNSMADDQGRVWSLMDGQECVFRPAAAAIPRPVARFVSWEDAPACEEQPSESNSVADDSGRLWGWQAGASCAFKSEEAAARGAKGDAAHVAAADAAAAEASRVSVVWEAAPSCSFSPNEGNAVPDTYGRLWSWENGRSCAFKWQSLPTRRL